MLDASTRTVTFLFTDIEGSTARWERYPDAMGAALARHDAILRHAIEAHAGQVFKTIGDAFCAAFATAPEALAAALEAQRALDAEPWGEVGALRVRMALQTGTAELRDLDYFGPPLNRVARLLAAGHGGQVLLALPTAELVRDCLPEGAELRDLGEHRLKDLARPERVFQLIHPALPAEFLTLRTLDLRPNNLPGQATPLVGREQEVAEARARLLRPEVRLLTLTGPGGTGKTRLGLQVAADLIDHFADGVFFVPLASVADAGQVPVAIVQALGLQESGGRSLVDGLKEYLGPKQLLLVLDNFEQVPEAAPLVSELLQACPLLKVLVTSRALLRVYGEQDFPVPPLAMPDLRRLPPIDQLAQYEAVRLFIVRAQAVKPDFAVTNDNAPAVAEICHRLDGLPLAIELAAARVRLLPPQAILTRLERRLPLLTGGARDLPARQQTLRGAIAWGYDLLEPGEQQLLRRLAVFAGGCTLEAAEAVCGADGDLEVDVLDGVSSLADKSLLRQQEDDAVDRPVLGPAATGSEPRFSMLLTIREFALEQLEASGEAAALRRRHAEYFFAVGHDADGGPKLRGPNQPLWLERLEDEHDNLRAALEWFRASGDVDSELRLAGGLWWFWYLRAHLSEGRGRLEGALALPGADAPTVGRARALYGAAGLAWLQSDFPAAGAWAEESLRIYQELGHQEGTAYSLSQLGQVALGRGDHAAARVLYAQAIAIFEQIGNRWGRALTLFFAGNAALVPGDLPAARAAYEESIASFGDLGDPWGRALPLAVLGRVAFQDGDLARARAMLEESLATRTALGDKWGQAQLLNGLGDVARGEGDYARARPLYEESLALFRDSGSQGGIASLLHNLGYVAQAGGDFGRAAALLSESVSRFEALGDRRGVADGLAGLAGLAVRSGEPERGARLLGASEAMLEALGSLLWASNQAEYDRTIAAARAALGDGAFEAARDAGKAMGAEDAIAYGLEAAAPS